MNVGFFILFSSDHFPFLVDFETNIKNMVNCISRTSKDHFFANKEGMKNKTSFEKGKVRHGLDMVAGGTYMKLYSIKKYSKTLAPLQTGMWGRNLF